MTTIVNGWNVCVEKPGQQMYSQLSINKLWIPDDVIWVVKDYICFNGIELKRQFYKFAINSSILRMTLMNPRFLSNSLGLPRLVYWACLLTDDWKKERHLQSLICIDCAEPAKLHNNSCTHDDNEELKLPEHLANNEERNICSGVNLTVDAIPEDLLTVESNHVSLLNKSNHSAQWSIISNDNLQTPGGFDEWDNDGQEFGYDSDWYAESRDV
jgi:hypothetical protein